METLVLTLDTIAMVVILYFSYKGEKAPGQPELGPFRIRAPKSAPSPSTAVTARAGREAQLPARRR